MIRLFVFLLICISLDASKILSYNIYDRSDRVDVMITFDTPYDGKIRQSVSDSKITIKLQNAFIESSKFKQVSSKFLNSLTITPMANYTQIVVSLPHSVHLRASKTSDAYGLRLRFSNKAKNIKSTTAHSVQKNIPFSLPTKKSDNIEKSYYIVSVILVVGILILLFIKKRVSLVKTNNNQKNSWLFKENNTASKENNTSVSALNTTNAKNVSIRFQKSINNDSSVVMLDFMEQSYLVLMGKNNILLDKFTDNKPVSQEDFETILQERHKELEGFIQTQKEQKEPLQAYKERAASIAYDL